MGQVPLEHLFMMQRLILSKFEERFLLIFSYVYVIINKSQI